MIIAQAKVIVQLAAIELRMPMNHPMLQRLDSRKPSYVRRLAKRIAKRLDEARIAEFEAETEDAHDLVAHE